MDGSATASGIFLQLFVLFLLILMNAFFAMSEIAIITLNDNKIARMAEDGHKKAKQVLKLTANSSNFLSTIQIGITLAGFLTSASASRAFVDKLTGLIEKIPYIGHVGQGVISGFSIIIITVIMSYFSLVLGELVPKRIAMQVPEKVSFKVIGILLFVAKIAKPFVKVLSFSTNVLVRLLGFDPNASQKAVTEEEIRMLVDVGGEHGVIEEVQKEMINNIFEFDDIDVSDIMTHRTNIAAVDVDDPLDEVVKIAMDEGYSRIPVYEEDLDNIIGIVYIKDLLKFIGNDLPEGKVLRDVMRKAYYIPETKRCGELFKEMTASHVQMAIVVDEYGGTAGLISLEDLLEAIVGNIQDEYDNESEEISKINETTFTIDGITAIDEVDELVGTAIPEGEYDTLAGFVISLLGFLPQDGEMNIVEYENLRFTVLRVEDRRIDKVKVEILPIKSTNERKKDDD
ncbi:MAG: hemolysin family protein [Eubacteriales bacterium]